MKKKTILIVSFGLFIALTAGFFLMYIKIKSGGLNEKSGFLEYFEKKSFLNLYQGGSLAEIAKNDTIPSIAEPTYSLLNGEQIAEKEEVISAVVIENHPNSRAQQMGLSKASIVYEAEAEGGITRYLAIYSNQNLEKVGPVRSARPYFLSWAREYNGGYAHAGGSPEALSLIQSSGLTNLEGLYYEELGNKYFFRDLKYKAPHNLFTNLISIKELTKEKKEDPKIPASRFNFGTLNTPGLEIADKVTINFSENDYQAEYTYDKNTESYFRVLAGEKHLDHLDETQIAPKNLIVQITSYYASDEKGRLEMKVIGEGEALFFRDGKVIEGTWKKENNKTKTIFYEEQGKEIVLRRGQIWISVIKDREMAEWEKMEESNDTRNKDTSIQTITKFKILNPK